MQSNYVFMKRDDLHDLFPIYVGFEECEPSHHFGPAIRDFCIIHYVKKGCGVFTRGGIDYHVHPGQAFVILPGEVTYYIADEKDPWEYYWISFAGSLAEKFNTLESPIITPSGDIFIDSVIRAQEGNLSTEYVMSKLFLLYGELFSDNCSTEQNIPKRIARYIRHNYMEELSLDSLAKMANLDRRYLTRIFKEETGQSIYPYILSIRCAKATEFLKLGYNVKQTANMVGYPDAYTFSKMFKKQTGFSPSDIRSKSWDWNLVKGHSFEEVTGKKLNPPQIRKKSK